MYNTQFLEKMVVLERAINDAKKFAEQKFMETGHDNGFGNDECTEWYQAMKAMEAMTDIKCMINVHASNLHDETEMCE